MGKSFTIPDLDAEHGFVLERHDSVVSTQDVLRCRLEAGEVASGVAVRALQQTAGRGRRGNAWSSRAGGSYQSVGLPVAGNVIAPDGGAASAALLPLALSVGVAAAFTQAGAQTLVKWPNDLVLGGRKLGGIIVEMVGGVPVAGIGVNVENDVPHGVAALRGWDVDTVGDLVLLGVRHALLALASGPGVVIAGFASVDWLQGKSVLMAGAPQPGRAQGIDAGGCLLLVDPAGITMRHCSGHIVAIDGAGWSP